ncbi:MAG: hypothetical protein KAW45_01835 [Thermoplasmatales archaeon]|nr:hypothetical protein [Thermoplasmatales archaeon]
MFCVECGKDGPIFRDGVCISCYLKTHTFTKGPDIIDLPVCSHCGSYKYKSTWTSDLFGDVIRRLIKHSFQISRELNKVDINTECNETKEGMFCKVYISGFIDDVEITEEHDLSVRLKRTVCDVCSKQFGGYHEAIVQIRTDRTKLTKKETNDFTIFVENIVEESQSKGNRGLFITDVGKGHGGLDFFISEKGPALVIAKKIQERYGGKIKQSSKNIGMKDGRQIYRMTYLIRLPSYKKGDFLRNNNMFLHIVSIHGNTVKMIDLSNWDESTVDIRTIQKAKILGNEELIEEMILVSQTADEIQIMDPKTYGIKVIKKPKPIEFKKEKVKILKTEKQIFLIPNKN